MLSFLVFVQFVTVVSLMRISVDFCKPSLRFVRPDFVWHHLLDLCGSSSLPPSSFVFGSSIIFFGILGHSVIIMSNVTINATVSGLEVFWGCRDAWGLSPFWLAVAIGLFVVVGVGWLVERRGRLVVGIDLDEAVSLISKLFIAFLSWVAGRKCLGATS